jgi:multidrug efflux pump subunit AcrA (membrane-fusion protein)
MNYIETNFNDDREYTPDSFHEIYMIRRTSRIKYWTFGLLFALIGAAFLPWTQNIRSKGKVTTLRQEQRPQGVNSAISGRVAKWYVKEGDFVQKGDTIAQLQEVKAEYLDPNLLARTQEQIIAKRSAATSYQDKAQTADQQYSATQEGLKLKVQQLQNKIIQAKQKLRADSTDMMAARNEANIASEQFSRQKQMYEQGLASLTQLEQRNQAYQNAQAKKMSAEIKYVNSKQDVVNLGLELNSTRQEYTEKLSKISGDRFQSLSQISSYEADIAKLENQYSSYKLRNELYFVVAPQSGQITKAAKAGVAEIVKEGEELVEIVPTNIDVAVEIFVKPLDIPLVNEGEKVMLLFDGYPGIVFSGWPRQSFGTFSGKVLAISNTVNEDGLFRVLLSPNPDDRKWPNTVRLGTAADTFTLLKDVPLIYELWRNINGFPPEYYKATKKDDVKEK